MNKQLKLLCLSLAFLAGSAQASTVTFTQNGSAGLFGASQQPGNDTFFFSPSDFAASTTNLGSLGYQKTESQTSLILTALAGYEINTISLLERGSYNQSNIIDNSSTHFGTVSVSGNISAVNNESPITPALQSTITSSTVFAHTGEDDNLDWSATAQIDASSLHTKAITLSILNILKAKALTLGDDAFINKNFVGISVTTSAVPLPTAVWLFGAALFGVLSVSKQKKQL